MHSCAPVDGNKSRHSNFRCFGFVRLALSMAGSFWVVAKLRRCILSRYGHGVWSMSQRALGV